MSVPKLALPDVLQARILIVDDQPANVALLERLLSESGYVDVSATLNPHDVEGLHRAQPYDLILLDLQMPGLDGFGVMDALRTIDADAYLPVIVLTAQPGHKLRALEAGAKDFISKPFDLIEVKTRIRNMLEVRLLYKQLDLYNRVLESTVLARTAELAASEARFRRLTELACDWYWEQDEHGRLITVHGPALEMLGVGVGSDKMVRGVDVADSAWNEHERATLRELIEGRQPFLDFVFTRYDLGPSVRRFRISGEPIFNPSGRFTGYRGIGIEFDVQRSAATLGG